jgi:hypothetical protein
MDWSLGGIEARAPGIAQERFLERHRVDECNELRSLEEGAEERDDWRRDAITPAKSDIRIKEGLGSAAKRFAYEAKLS